jgi:predicted enzyme related to lactoylglutathione lyase
LLTGREQTAERAGASATPSPTSDARDRTDEFSGEPAFQRWNIGKDRIHKGGCIVDWKLEVVLVPVSDVDRAKNFYIENVGFKLDVDHRAGDDFRVVQLTPPGSACSISIGTGITSAAPGSVRGLHLVVSDIEAARVELVERGTDVSEIFHFEAGGRLPGPHPQRSDYGSFLSFSDPDGNTWLVQEVGRSVAEA